MTKFKNFIQKMSDWELALIAFVLFFLVIVFNAPKDRLTGDEVFYYFQAQHLRQGELVWFENTQPLLYPAVLALTFTDDITILRMVSALFMALAVLVLSKLAKKLFGLKAGVLASLIFIFHKETIQLGTTLFTESLFILLLLLSFYYFFKIYKKKAKIKEYILFGLLIGLAAQTKVVGLFLPAFFALYILFSKPKLLSKKIFWLSLLITFLIFLPYLLIGGSKFLSEKSLNTGVFNLGYLSPLPQYITWPLLILALLAIFFEKKEEKHHIFVYFLIFYFVFALLLIGIIFERYFYISIPLISLIVAGGIPPRALKYLFLALIIFTFFINIKAIPSLPHVYSQNYYLKIPKNCLEIKKMNCSCFDKNFEVKLPFFSQPSKTLCRYTSAFQAKENYRYFLLNYLDDYGSVKVDGQPERLIMGPYETNKIDYPVSPGHYTMNLWVINEINIGGIGQILWCH